MSKKKLLHNGWSEVPTPELDKLLQLELQKEEPNEEVVLGIMRVLQEREAQKTVEVTEDIQDAWERYREKAAKPKKSSRKQVWLVRVAAAAVIGIVILAMPRTVGAESLLDAFFRWTESIFEFFTPEQDATKPSFEYVFKTDDPGLQQVYDKVTELGAAEPVVPMWLPEGFELTELKTIQMPDGNTVSAFFCTKDGYITLSYRMSADILPSKYEKEESGVEAYETSEVHHLIMNNDENILVTWTVDGVECSINTDLEREKVYKLIDSIYRTEIS